MCTKSDCGVSSFKVPGCINIYGDLNECCSTSIICGMSSSSRDYDFCVNLFVESLVLRHGHGNFFGSENLNLDFYVNFESLV